jgi:hypothetical protein
MAPLPESSEHGLASVRSPCDACNYKICCQHVLNRFERAFRHDLALKLGIAPDRIVISEVCGFNDCFLI